MDNFFTYIPLSVCIIFNIKDSIKLKIIKECLYSVINSLESATEDKIIVYDGSGKENFANFLGESVASVSNYRYSKIDLPIAIRDSIYILHESPCGSRRKLILFTEKFDDIDVCRAEESLRANRRYNVGTDVIVVTFSDEVTARAEKVKDDNWFVCQVEVNSKHLSGYLKELINDQSQKR